jgi:hypothetical protein
MSCQILPQPSSRKAEAASKAGVNVDRDHGKDDPAARHLCNVDQGDGQGVDRTSTR